MEEIESIKVEIIFHFIFWFRPPVNIIWDGRNIVGSNICQYDCGTQKVPLQIHHRFLGTNSSNTQ